MIRDLFYKRSTKTWQRCTAKNHRLSVYLSIFYIGRQCLRERSQMETILYADVLFLVNFAMDFISLSASASLGAKQKSPLKISLAAALGSVYAITSVISNLGPLPDLILTVLVGAAMCAISFGFGKPIPFIRQYLIFWCSSALLGGIMTALLSLGSTGFSLRRLPTTIIASALFTFFTIRAIRHRAGCKSLFVTVSLNKRTASFGALCDSGNLLRDPFSAAPVIIASHEVLAPLLTREALSAMLDGSPEKIPPAELRIRLIPQKTASGSALLCAFYPDQVIISSGKRAANANCLIAVSPQNKAYFAGFAATCPSILIP